MTRTIYLTVFALLAAVAGILYYSQTRLAPIVVATTSLKVGTQIEESDVAIRRVAATALPAGALTRTDQAVGRFVSFPILQGQFLDARQVAPARTADLLQSGLNMPRGSRIISLPIQPAAAVGGTLKPGDRVDVIAVANSGKTSAGTDQSGLATIIGKRVLVLGMRNDQGGELDPKASARTLAVTPTKAASILLAIPEVDLTRYSAAVVTSTFFFALATD